ncbi:unnamed protein product [Prunus brigantina]
MSSFMEKFVLVVVAVYLLVGVSSATSTLLCHGGEKSLSHIDCRDGMGKIIGRKRALVLLLMGEFQATCAFLRAEADQGIVKSTLPHVDCTRDGLRKINTGRKEGSFGSCQTDIFSKKIVPIRRNLRPLRGPKPPSPTKNFPPNFRPKRPFPRPPPPPSFNHTYSPES